jgi:hypothetical protein
MTHPFAHGMVGGALALAVCLHSAPALAQQSQRDIDRSLVRIETRMKSARTALAAADKARRAALNKAKASDFKGAKRDADFARDQVQKAKSTSEAVRDEKRRVIDVLLAQRESSGAPVGKAEDALVSDPKSAPTSATQAIMADRAPAAIIDDAQALEREVSKSEADNEAISDEKLEDISFSSGDTIRYGLTLAAARLRVTRSPTEEARLRDYKPEAEFVPTLIGFRIVYSPHVSPWRLESSGSPLQLLSIEFPLYLEKAKGNSLAAVSAGVGLTFVNGLLGIGLAFDVYRAVPVAGGTTRIGILPWALSRTGEVTAENVAVMLTLGLESLVTRLSGGSGTASKGSGS